MSVPLSSTSQSLPPFPVEDDGPSLANRPAGLAVYEVDGLEPGRGPGLQQLPGHSAVGGLDYGSALADRPAVLIVHEVHRLQVRGRQAPLRGP